MEDSPINEMYFIFCQKIENRVKVSIDQISIIHSSEKKEEKTISDNNIYTLYKIVLSKDYKGKPFTLTLIDDKAECYMSYIYSKKNEKIKFKYDLTFEPIYTSSPNNLKQEILPFDTQFLIFYEYLKNKNDDKNNNDIYTLFLDSIDYLADNKSICLKQRSLIFLFLEINKLKNNDKEINKSKILEIFFTKINLAKLFEYFILNKKNLIGDVTLDELRLLKTKRNELISITGNKEEINEKIDLFLMFYVIYRKKDFFMEILFENNGQNYSKIKSHLLKYKKLFKDFNSDIFDVAFFYEATKLETIILLIKDFMPNMLEVLKLFSILEFYMKFSGLLQAKIPYNIINILDLSQPQKTDETQEFLEYFSKIFDNYRCENFIPIKFDENFYFAYCKLFQNENYKKIYSIYEVLQFHNKSVGKKFRINIEQDILQYYHNTGIYLIQKKLLYNKEMLLFLNRDYFLIDDDLEKEAKLKKILDTISIGIHFDQKETKFFNDILNNKSIDDFNVQSFFGNLYGEFIKTIFNKISTPEDLLSLGKCEIYFDTPKELLENFVLMLQRIWISHPVNYPENIKKIIAQSLSYSSAKIPEINEKVYKSLEKGISSDILISVYCLILLKQYPTSVEFRGHLIDYIKNYCEQNPTPLSVWYLLNTIEPEYENERFIFLKNNLKDEYIVKAEDFFGCFNKRNEKILLFQYLREHKCFLNILEGELITTSYYKESLKSINNILNLKFHEAMYIYKNIYNFKSLFMYFTPIEQERETAEFNIELMLINLTEKIGPIKTFFDNFEKIYNFFEQFYPNERKEETSKIKNIIEIMNNVGMDDFENVKTNNMFYIDKFLIDAEEGEKLKDSLFFMAIYNYLKEKNYKDNDCYTNAIKLFSNLKNLENEKGINKLENELQNIIIATIYNNRNRLNKELEFLKNYFYPKNDKEKEYNEQYNSFNIPRIKRQLLKLVNNLKKDFEKDLEELNNQEEEENYGIENNEIDERFKTYNSKKLVIEENRRLIEKIHKLGNEYIYYSKINHFNDKTSDDKEKLINSFVKFFKELFNTNFGFAKLGTDTDFNEKILNFIKKIYMNNLEIDLSINENSLILISEFFDIFETFEKYGKNSKSVTFNLLQKMKEIYDIENDNHSRLDYPKIVIQINSLFDFIQKNVKGKELEILLLNLLVKEGKKSKENNFYLELLNLIFTKFSPDFSLNFLYAYLSPFIDQLFGEEITQCLNFQKRPDNQTDILASSRYPKCFGILDSNIRNNIILEETMLFYFESKIMFIFDNSFRDEDFLEINNGIYSYLEYFLHKLEEFELFKRRNDVNQNNNRLLKIFSIAYIKCYYYKLINYLYANHLVLEKDFKNIIEDIYTGKANQEFKNSMMIYVLKLVFRTIGYLDEFEIGEKYYKHYMNIFENFVEEVKNNGYWDFEKIVNQYSGFDFIIYPNNNQDKFFQILDNVLVIKKNCINQDNYKETLYSNINSINDIDLLYCLLLNIIFSFYYRKFSDENNTKLILWLNEIVNNKELQILKDNQSLTNILLLLIKNDSFSKIEQSIDTQNFSYYQLFGLLIAFRFVLNIVQFNNKEGLFYNYINDPKNIFIKNEHFFNIYLDEINKDQRDINYLTYKIIKYIIYSHLYIANLLEKKEEGNNLLKKLLEEFEFIKNDLLKTLGINNTIIFMNSIFDDILALINTLNINSKENEIKGFEQKINKIINAKISSYSQSIEDYYATIKKYQKEANIEESYKKAQEFYDILFEKNSFFNSKNKHEDLPYISYLTYTNYNTYDDFKKQYLYFKNDAENVYFENDAKSYPIIDCILKENKIFKIIEFIPELNQLVNSIYNKLSMNITEEESKQKIRSIIPDFDFNKFNDSLKQFSKKLNEDQFFMEIKDDSIIADVININKEDNKIFKIYNWVINEYNEFMKTLNIYIENERYIKEVIIQNCTDNDYISFKSNNKSIKDRLKEIIYLYSRRNRINSNEKINVYDGSKIIYNFELIEDMLEKEFVLCKRKFSKFQRFFIFSDKIFSNERNKLFKDLENIFPQEEINGTDSVESITTYLNSNENNIKKIYYNCLYLIIYLVYYLRDKKILNSKKPKINDIIKLMEKENNIFSQEFKSLFEFIEIRINQIFRLYEKIEEKAFPILIEKIKDETKEYKNIIALEEEENIQNILNDNTLLKQDDIKQGIKKYIMRYYLGDMRADHDLKKIKFKDIFNRIDVWDKVIFKDGKFKEEVDKLLTLNQKENNLLIYFYGIIFENEVEEEENEESDEPDYEEDKI